MTRIFLDVGHWFGAKPGAEFGNIIEPEYNVEILTQLSTLWRARVAIENLLSLSKHIGKIFRNMRGINSLPYVLVQSDDTTDFLIGRYSEKAKELNEHDLADVVIQMHLNAGRGSYGMVGFVQDDAFEKDSFEIAKIAAEELESMSDQFGGILSKVRVDGCSKFSEEPFRRRIHYCLRDYERPAILMEPMFLDNQEHNAFLDSDEGREAMAVMYARILERVAEYFNE